MRPRRGKQDPARKHSRRFRRLLVRIGYKRVDRVSLLLQRRSSFIRARRLLGADRRGRRMHDEPTIHVRLNRAERNRGSRFFEAILHPIFVIIFGKGVQSG